MKKIVIVLLLLFTLPCFATQTRTIKDANAKVMTKELSKFFIKNNCQVENLTETSFTGKESVNGSFAQLMLSPNGMAGSAKYKYDFIFMQDGKDVIVSFTGTTISNDQSVTRFSTPWNYEAEFRNLENLEGLFCGYYTLGINVSHWFKSLYVTDVLIENSPFQRKDRIKEINGMPAHQLTNGDILSILHPVKKEPVKIKVKRKKEFLSFEAVPIYISPKLKRK